MKLFSKQELENAFAVMPDDIKTVLSAESAGNDVALITKENNLHIDQMGILNEEIAFVMLGLVKTSDFQPRIQERLGLDAEKTKKLTEAVNEKMFAPLRVSIMKLGQESDSDIDDLDSRYQTFVPLKKEVVIDRADVLSGIEDEPETVEVKIAPVPTTPLISFADKKLDTPTVTAPQKVTIGVAKPAVDPYREAI